MLRNNLSQANKIPGFTAPCDQGCGTSVMHLHALTVMP